MISEKGKMILRESYSLVADEQSQKVQCMYLKENK